MATPSWFDDKVYFANKLASLDGYNDMTLTAAFKAAGYANADGKVDADSLYQHFLDWGDAENISPSAYFDANYYMQSKAAEYYNKSFDDVTQADVNNMKQAFADAGLSAWDHYVQYGWKEGVDPSANFDTSAYLDAKLAQLQASDPAGNWTAEKLTAALSDAGLTPISHYEDYGKSEGLSYTPKAIVVTESDTISLTHNDDVLTGTSMADVFTGTVGTLNNGDAIDGLAGNDTLKVAMSDEDYVAPTVKNVEKVVLTAQHDSSVDAGNISGMTTIESSNSRADLLVEDVRTNSNATTVAMVSTDPVSKGIDGSASTSGIADTNDFTVLFNDNYLKTDAATTSGTLNIQLIDTVGALTTAEGGNGNPLWDNPYTGFTFTMNGTLYTVNFGAYNHTTTAAGTTPSYAGLVEQIQNAIKADTQLSALNLTVALDGTFDATVGIGAHKGESVTGNVITISSSNSALTAGTWIAANGLPTTNSTSATMANYSEGTCPLIVTDIVLDNVGQVQWDDAQSACLPDESIFGSEAGDLVVGGMGTRAGVERFDVTVDRGSWISSLSSTNNTLRMVTAVNGTTDTDGNATSNGQLFIGDSLMDGTDDFVSWQDAPRLLSTDGLKDVAVFDASAMTGVVNVGASITEASNAKYLSDVDGNANIAKWAPLAGYDDAFTYNLGANNDSLNMKVNGGILADNDFKLVMDGKAGDDLINYYVGNSSDSSVVGHGFSTANQLADQQALNNVTINGGDGNDVIKTPGDGNVKINGGAGNDVIYTDNTGVHLDETTKVMTNDNAKAIWVLNADTTDARATAVTVDAVNGAQPLDNDILSTQSGDLNLTGQPSNGDYVTFSVSFKGIVATSKVVLNDSNYDGTTLDGAAVRQGIIDAINGNDTLSHLLVAKDGAGNSVLVESLVDGEMAADTLALKYSFTDDNVTGDVADLTAYTPVLASLATVDTTTTVTSPTAGQTYTPGTTTTTTVDGTTTTVVETTTADDGTVTATTSTTTFDKGSATGSYSTANTDNVITGGAGDDLIVLAANGKSIDGTTAEAVTSDGYGTQNINIDSVALSEETVVLGDRTSSGIDTVLNFSAKNSAQGATDNSVAAGNGDVLAFNGAATVATVWNLTDTYSSVDAVLAAQGASLGQDSAATFSYNGMTYVVIDSGDTAGYQAGEDAVVALAGVTTDNVKAMGDIFVDAPTA